MNPLDDLAFKYGTDKTPRIHHPYTPFYYELLKDKKINSVLEIGIGGKMYRDKLIRDGFHAEVGASLKMWRDFFPEAKIYGIDNDPECIFQEEGIQTFLCNATQRDHLRKLIKRIGQPDLVIDDASHYPAYQVKTAKILLPMLKKDVLYIIEDVRHHEYVMEGLKEYKIEMPDMPRRIRGDRVLIIENI